MAGDSKNKNNLKKIIDEIECTIKKTTDAYWQLLDVSFFNVHKLIHYFFFNQVNQLLSLFFMVMVQVVIMAEWFVINMPITAIQTRGNLHCDVPKVENKYFEDFLEFSVGEFLIRDL